VAEQVFIRHLRLCAVCQYPSSYLTFNAVCNLLVISVIYTVSGTESVNTDLSKEKSCDQNENCDPGPFVRRKLMPLPTCQSKMESISRSSLSFPLPWISHSVKPHAETFSFHLMLSAWSKHCNELHI